MPVVICLPAPATARSSLSAPVVSQLYHVQVHDEYVLLGNGGQLRCLVPSFVSDFVAVDGWTDDAERFFAVADHHHGTLAIIVIVRFVRQTPSPFFEVPFVIDDL